MSSIGGADRDISGHSTTVTVGNAIEVDGLIVGPNMVRHCRERIAEFEAELRHWRDNYAGSDPNVIPVPRYQIDRLLGE